MKRWLTCEKNRIIREAKRGSGSVRSGRNRKKPVIVRVRKSPQRRARLVRGGKQKRRQRIGKIGDLIQRPGSVEIKIQVHERLSLVSSNSLIFLWLIVLLFGHFVDKLEDGSGCWRWRRRRRRNRFSRKTLVSEYPYVWGTDMDDDVQTRREREGGKFMWLWWVICSVWFHLAMDSYSCTSCKNAYKI